MINDIFTSLKYSSSYTLMNKLTTNNAIIDAILTAILMGLIGELIKNTEKIKIYINNIILQNYLNNKNSVTINGKNSTAPCYGELYCNTLYSVRFNAMMNYITKNIYYLDDIRIIKELCVNKTGDSDIVPFTINQMKPIQIADSIFLTVTYIIEEDEVDKKKTKVENICLEIFSYTLSVSYNMFYR